MQIQELTIEYWPIERLSPDPKNPKKHPESQLVEMEKSVKNYKTIIPLLITGKGMIKAGEGRYMVGRRLGIKKLPCIIIDYLSKAQQDAFMMVENKSGELGVWDSEKAYSLMESLENAGIDLDTLCVTSAELDTLYYNIKNIDLDNTVLPIPKERKPAGVTLEENNNNDKNVGNDLSFGDVISKKDKLDAYDVVFAIGEYRFEVERKNYLVMIENIRQSVGFDRGSIVAEIRRRLCI